MQKQSYAQDTTKEVILTFEEFKGLELIIEDNKFLNELNNKLDDNIGLYKRADSINTLKSFELNNIIKLQGERIKVLEATPQTVIENVVTPWWKITLWVLGAFGVGVTAGIVYENNK